MSKKITLHVNGYIKESLALSLEVKANENRRIPAEITAAEMIIAAGNQVMIKSLETSGGNHHYVIIADLSTIESFTFRGRTSRLEKKRLEKLIEMMEVIKIQVKLEPEEKIISLPPGA